MYIILNRPVNGSPEGVRLWFPADKAKEFIAQGLAKEADAKAGRVEKPASGSVQKGGK